MFNINVFEYTLISTHAHATVNSVLLVQGEESIVYQSNKLGINQNTKKCDSYPLYFLMERKKGFMAKQ